MMKSQKELSMLKTSMVLPGVPRLTDEKGRQKWISEYDKLEGELLKHHLTGAGPTATISVKMVPVTFNRVLPDPEEPTAAERLFNEQQRARRKKRRGTTSASKKPTQSAQINLHRSYSPNTGGLQLSSDLVDAEGSSCLRWSMKTMGVSRPSVSPRQAQAATSCSPSSSLALTAAADMESFGRAADTATTSTTTVTSAAATATPSALQKGTWRFDGRTGKEALSISSMYRTVEEGLEALADDTLPVPLLTARPGSATTSLLHSNVSSFHIGRQAEFSMPRVRALTKRDFSSTTPQSVSPVRAQREPSTTPTRGITRGAVRVKSPQSPQRAELEMQGAKTNPKPSRPSTKVANERTAPRSPAPSPPRAAAASPPPIASHPLDQLLELNHTRLSVSPERAKALVATLTNETVVQPRVTESLSGGCDGGKGGIGDLFTSAMQCARLLSALLATPAEFASSFELDLSHIDISWVVDPKAPPRPPVSLTLNRLNINAEPRRVEITSPRSALVLLSNGVRVKDVMERMHGTVGGRVDRSGYLVDTALMASRRAHNRALREQLLQMLVDDYQQLCGVVSLDDIVTHCRNPHLWREELVALPTALIKQRERQKILFASNQRRLERQMDFIEMTRQRQKLVEQRHVQTEKENELRLAEKQEVERLARRKAEERLKAAHLQAERIAEQTRLEMEHRMEMAEERSQLRKEAQQRNAELLHARRLEKIKVREERMRRKDAVLEAVRLDLEARAEEKEQHVRKLRMEREERRKLEELELLARQKAAEEARVRVKQRAAEDEALLRETALLRQQKAAERIAAFMQAKASAFEARQKRDEEHRRKNDAIQARAEEQERARRLGLAEKLSAHDATLQARLEERRLAEIVRSEREQQTFSDKKFFLQRRTRAGEFAKLVSISSLMARQEAAHELQAQKEQVKQQLSNERRLMESERESYKKDLQATLDMVHKSLAQPLAQN